MYAVSLRSKVKAAERWRHFWCIFLFIVTLTLIFVAGRWNANSFNLLWNCTLVWSFIKSGSKANVAVDDVSVTYGHGQRYVPPFHGGGIPNYIKYIPIAPFCSKPSAWLFSSFCIEIQKKKSKAVFTNNHMNTDKKTHPQLLRQEQPFIWQMVIQIGLGTGMHVPTYSVLFRFGIFVSLNCIPFQFLCTFHFV